MQDQLSTTVLPTTVLIVPGLRDHVAEHWQTLLAEKLPRVRTVPPLEANKLSCAARVEAIQAELDRIDGPVILVAHSAGVLMVAHWAATARRPIKGALLAAPPDLDATWPDNYPTPDSLRANGWAPLPREPLPFPSILAASSNDYLASFDAAAALARDWNSELVDLGEVGHLNPASGFGEWPEAEALIQRLEG
ncbi:alpha/beta hydrolase [Marinobacterium nitratireducens]|uniref:Alpha/beta hydrolase n=1 Tax=Marinobacterium nitratireducens TaxID=518897 RepID=A0A917ZLC1_9GAMM|nr:alpha/beta hydrolase [Marinobacterium nitratireducens]GGO84271.1 alpha/beta hydrolase [Marinobacterium nitratireducens]